MIQQFTSSKPAGTFKKTTGSRQTFASQQSIGWAAKIGGSQEPLFGIAPFVAPPLEPEDEAEVGYRPREERNPLGLGNPQIVRPLSLAESVLKRATVHVYYISQPNAFVVTGASHNPIALTPFGIVAESDLAVLTIQCPGSAAVPTRESIASLWREAATTDTEAKWYSFPISVEGIVDHLDATDLDELLRLARSQPTGYRKAEAVVRALAVVAENPAMDKQQIRDALELMSQHKSSQVRLAVAEVASQIKDVLLIPILHQLANDPNTWVRDAAESALRVVR